MANATPVNQVTGGQDREDLPASAEALAPPTNPDFVATLGMTPAPATGDPTTAACDNATNAACNAATSATPGIAAVSATSGSHENDTPTRVTAAYEPPPDPFDPARLRLSQDFGASLGVKKELLTVPVRKPTKESWVRTHPAETYRLQTLMLELKDDREIYLIARDLWPELATESTVSSRMLFTTMDRQGALFLWPLRLPGPDGKIDDWSRSALEAATMATKQWVRVAANMAIGAYDVFTTTASLPDPKWPDVPLSGLLRVAFKDRYIDRFEHPVLQRLRGEA